MACANHDGDAARQHGAGPPPGPNPLAPPSPPYAAAEAAPGQCDGRRTPPPFGRPSSPHVLDRHRHRGCRWPHVSSRCSSFAERSPVAPQPEKPPVVRTLSLPAARTEGQDCGAHAPAACSPQNPVHASPPPAGCSGPCPAAAQQNCSRDDHHGARLYDSSTPSSSAPSPVPWEAEDEWRVRHYQSHTPAAGFQAAAAANAADDRHCRFFQGTLPLPYEPAAAPQYPSPVSAPASPDFARPNPRQQLDAHAMLDRQRRRRENHNVVERRRRDTINNTIDDIAHALPARYLGGRKPNKGLVLKTAILYIENLKKEIVSLRKRLGIDRECDGEDGESRARADVHMLQVDEGLSSPLSSSHRNPPWDTKFKTECASSVSERLYAAAAAAVDAGKSAATPEHASDPLRQRPFPKGAQNPGKSMLQLPELLAPLPLRRPPAHHLFSLPPSRPHRDPKFPWDPSAGGVTLPPLSALRFDSNPPSGCPSRCPSPVIGAAAGQPAGRDSPPFLLHPPPFQHHQQVPLMTLQPPDILLNITPLRHTYTHSEHGRSPCPSPNLRHQAS